MYDFFYYCRVLYYCLYCSQTITVVLFHVHAGDSFGQDELFTLPVSGLKEKYIELVQDEKRKGCKRQLEWSNSEG